MLCYMVVSSVVQFIEFLKNNNQFWFFWYSSDSENRPFWFFVKMQNQRTVVDSSYFKNTKEPTILMKEPTILWPGICSFKRIESHS
jgi:hypothetical protein